MILKRYKLLYSVTPSERDILLFTANSVIKGDGSLVMGAGCAKSVRDTYKGIDKLFGNKIYHLSAYGVRFVKYKEGVVIGAFQTKYSWKNESPIELVKYSITELKNVAEIRPDHTFHLPCPAVNHGGQSVESILPLLNILPDNVIVYLDK